MKSQKKLNKLNKIKNVLTVILIIIIIYLLTKHNLDIKNRTDKYLHMEQKLLATNQKLENKIQKLSVENEVFYRYKEIYDGLTNINIHTDTRYYDIPLTAYQQEFVQAMAEENGFAETYIYGLMQLESQFDVNASSDSSDGIMQVNRNFAYFFAELAGLKEYNLFNFEDNVRMGVAYLRYIRDYYISIGIDSQEDLSQLILVSYNMGINGVNKHIKKHGEIISRYGDIVLRNKMKIEQTSKQGENN